MPWAAFGLDVVSQVPPVAVRAMIDPKKDAFLSPPILGGSRTALRIAALAAGILLISIHPCVLGRFTYRRIDLWVIMFSAYFPERILKGGKTCRERQVQMLEPNPC